MKISNTHWHKGQKEKAQRPGVRHARRLAGKLSSANQHRFQTMQTRQKDPIIPFQGESNNQRDITSEATEPPKARKRKHKGQERYVTQNVSDRALRMLHQVKSLPFLTSRVMTRWIQPSPIRNLRGPLSPNRSNQFAERTLSKCG